MQLATSPSPYERPAEPADIRASGVRVLEDAPPHESSSLRGRAPFSASPLERVSRAYYEPLLRTARRLARDEAEAQDLVQDTFERALRRWGTFETELQERAFLQSILHNAFLDRCRRRAVRKTVSDDALDSCAAPPPSEPEPPPWATISPEQLRGAIDALEDGFQQVYRMHAIEQRSYKDIADTLAIPMSTVGTRLARARHKLKTLLVAAMGRKEGAP